MANNIRYFEHMSAYTAAQEAYNIDVPNVSYIEETDEVKYQEHYDVGAYDVLLKLTDGTYSAVTFSNGIIPNSAFSNRTDIVSAKIGEGITNIGALAFYGCYGLTSVSIPISVETISSDAFGNCSGLTKAEFSSLDALLNTDFASVDSNPLNYAHHLYIDGSEVTELVIPSSVTIVNKYSFIGGSNITSVTIPSSVTEIGVLAFYGCYGLTSVSIPISVETISSNAFGDCSGLTKAEFSSLDALLNTDFASVYSNPLKYAHHLYIDGSEVTELVIPSSVTIVNKYSFIGGSNITSVTIPSSVTEIGVSAFYGCDELQSVTLSEGLTKIGANAFSSCRSLKTITIPSTVTYLGTYSLGNYYVAESARTVLDVAYMLPTTPPSGWNRYDPPIELSTNGVIIVGCSVEDTYKTDSLWGRYKTSIFCEETYYVPSESVETYKTASGWSTYASRIQAIPN